MEEEEEEAVDCLLIHCGKAKILWDSILSSFGESWVMAETVKEILKAWQGKAVDKRRRKVWRAAPINVFWIIWNQCNNIAF